MPGKLPATPEILVITDKKEEKFLRKKTAPFDFSHSTKKEIQDLIARMKKIMHAANGVGLSANQIGLDMKVFVAEVPDAEGGHKFYAIFNPEIEKISEDKNVLEEGCLSIPGIFGDVPRASRIAIKAQDKNGRAVKIKAWGFLARVFQHEIDHLGGHVFTDRTKKLYIEK
jgi:peptide deformylase